MKNESRSPVGSQMMVVFAAVLLLAACENPSPVNVNTAPSFGDQRVADQPYTAGVEISALTLPAASGGDRELTYTLTPAVPGLSFDDKRTLGGTPTMEGEYEMTYAVADADGDQDSLTFNISVVKSTIPPGPLPPDQFDAVADAVFERFNREREVLGLTPFTRVRTSDASFDSFIEVWPLTIGCQASLRDDLEELQGSDLDGIGFAPWTEGTECALQVTTYHYLPMDRRMRVKDELWNCFKDSRDMRDETDVSCSGRYSFIEKHVKWLPSEVSYTIVEGESHEGKFEALIPWVEEKLGTTISKAASADDARLSLHLGGPLPPGCGHSYGCNTLSEDAGGYFAAIYVAAAAFDGFFDQVLKHELLHALLPMGHLPEGNHLMSVRPTDPNQTHTLSEREEKLLELYTHPYLRDGMRMDEFRRYLVIEP